MTGARPNLRIIDPNMDVYDEVSNDALSIRGFQEYRCNDYHLGMSDVYALSVCSLQEYKYNDYHLVTLCLAQPHLKSYRWFLKKNSGSDS